VKNHLLDGALNMGHLQLGVVSAIMRFKWLYWGGRDSMKTVVEINIWV